MTHKNRNEEEMNNWFEFHPFIAFEMCFVGIPMLMTLFVYAITCSIVFPVSFIMGLI